MVVIVLYVCSYVGTDSWNQMVLRAIQASLEVKSSRTIIWGLRESSVRSNRAPQKSSKTQNSSRTETFKTFPDDD